MFYTIYKTTNNINGKIYIGKHQTKDIKDSYIGSGKHLQNAIIKYGADNFTKEILFVFDSESEMNAKEAELVTEEFVKEHNNYNLCPGGQGGFGHINGNNLNGKPFRDDAQLQKNASVLGAKSTNKRLKDDSAFYDNWRKSLQGRLPTIGTTGKRFSEETKDKMSKSKIGNKNSQFGTMWITNGIENKKIKEENIIPEGWYKGRKFLASPQVWTRLS